MRDGKRTHDGNGTMRLLALLVLSLAAVAVALAAPSDIDITGAYKTSGTTRISSSGVGTFATGTTIGGIVVCLTDGTNCPGGAGAGWRNSTTQVYLTNNATNVTVGYVSSQPVLFIDNTNGRVGVGTGTLSETFTVAGTSAFTHSGSATNMFTVNSTGASSSVGASILLISQNGGGLTDGRSGGNVSFFTGTGGNGANPSNQGGSGGDLNLTTGLGGAGLTGGAGGKGGTVRLTTGSGGQSPSGVSGAGGPFIVATGKGGSADGSGNGSSGGDIQIMSGTGGNSSSGTAGRGGNLTITLGDGGNTTTSGGGSGDGGSFIVQAGNAGSVGKTLGNGGNIYLTPGLGGEGATNGSVIINRGTLALTGTNSNYLMIVNSNFSPSTSTPFAFSINPTIYGNRSFGAAMTISPDYQLTTNTGVVIGVNLGPGLIYNNYNITRNEVFRVTPNLASTYNGTIANMHMVKLIDPSRSNGSITTLVGFYSDDLTAGTNNRGMQLAVSSGTNKYNLYISGTADNYLAGNLGIGTASPANALAVVGSTNTTDLYINQSTAPTLRGNSTCNVFQNPAGTGGLVVCN